MMTAVVVNASRIVSVDQIDEITETVDPILAMMMGIDVIIAATTDAMTDATTTVATAPTSATEAIVVMITTMTVTTTTSPSDIHLQASIQLFQTFNMDGVTQDQMRARLFPFSLLGKALQWFYSQPAETVQNWDTLMRAFMKK
jgi:hypothetical protein